MLLVNRESAKIFCATQDPGFFHCLNIIYRWLSVITFARFVSLFLQVICLNILIISSASAMASQDDIFKSYIGAELLYDSNFFKLDKNLDPDSAIKGEFVKTINAGLAIDWTVSQQQFLIEADINQNWFQTFDELDYFGWDVGAQWNWQIGSDWNGKFAYSNKQTLGSYNQINVAISNIYNYAKYKASIGYLFHPSGRIRLAFFRTEIKFQAEGRQVSNLTENNAEFNLELLSPTGSKLGVRVLATDGDYPNRQFTEGGFLDQGYLRMDYAITYKWLWSTKTKIYGRAGYTQQDYDNLSSRNFGDFTAQLNVSWKPTKKVFILLSLWREIRQTENIQSNFNLSQGVLLNPSWDISPNIQMSSSISYEVQDYQELVGTDFERTDNIGKFEYNFIYKPFQYTTFDIMLGYERKHSNRQFRSFDSFTAGLNMLVNF